MKSVVIVQCRLSSSRLPRKALFDLDGKPLLAWALQSMKRVCADDFFVACDLESKDELFPIVSENGFKIFAGSKDDVLDRFCNLIEKEKIDIVVRATADNPFLFFDAANELLKLYKEKYFGKIDYITYNGLPHGCGIEIFDGKSLLDAKSKTDLSYDHEHVGPALYNHQDRYKCLFLDSPKKYNFPYYRTTIDTYADYIRCCDVIEILSNKKYNPPFLSEQVIEALKDESISKKILFIPSVKKGQGTGHFVRCANLAKKTKGVIYIDSENVETIEYERFLSSLDKNRIITKLPLKNEYDLIVCDMFKMNKEQIKKYSSLGKTLFLDEGAAFNYSPDYLLDIIPSYKLKRQSNLTNPFFIGYPKNQKSVFPQSSELKKVLICFGGEDSGNYTIEYVLALLKLGFDITVVSKDKNIIENKIPEVSKSKVLILDYVENLKEKLYEYDLVITHYGLTAFECVASKTPVLLSCPTKLHKSLAKKYGFCYLNKNQINSKFIKKVCHNVEKLKPKKIVMKESGQEDLSKFVLNMSSATKYFCPICKTENSKDKIIFRTIHHTFRKCEKCKMTYISFSDDSEKIEYEKSYFDTEYKNQYGKTYLEDFEFIKSNCVSRVKNINKIFKNKIDGKNILDIGCAYGPFLSCANDFGWNCFGSDISFDAINYVKNKLGFNAIIGDFASIDIKKEFFVDKFDVITMWYVIEHIKDLKSTLSSVNKMLKFGGVFSFSTPNANGLTRKIDEAKFFNQSPKDHFSLWELPLTKKYLKPFGFKVIKIVSTGIHPERIPFVTKFHLDKNKFVFNFLKAIIKLLKIGDTYEVYCKKINGPKV